MSASPGLIADLVGVAVFAGSGASAGVAKRFDIFGVVFVGVAAALGGGIVRDLLIGAVPPYAFLHWPYVAVAVGASGLLFWYQPQFDRLRRSVLVLDAAGLGLFTATGTLRAHDAGVPVVGATIIGMITGIGGGIARDLLTGEIPVVLRREIYAVAALIGAAVLLALTRLEARPPVAITVTAVVVFTIRLVALVRHWSAPTPKTVAPGAALGGGPLPRPRPESRPPPSSGPESAQPPRPAGPESSRPDQPSA